MAVTPQTNEAFLREVDEELRREQAEQLWKRYGRLIIGLVIGGLLAFGGILIWQNQQQQATGAEGEKVAAVFDQLRRGDVEGAKKPIADLAQSSREGYRATARFLEADIALEKNDQKAAAKIFAGIANDSAMPKPFRDLALIRQTSAEFDSLPPGTVIARLQPLATKDNPWFGSAGELVAIAYLNEGKPDRAGKLFAEISQDETLPQTLRARAVQMAGSLGVDAVTKNQGKIEK